MNKGISSHLTSNLKPLDLITGSYILIASVLAFLWIGLVQSAIILCCAFLIFLIPPLLRRLNNPISVFISDIYPMPLFAFLYIQTATFNQKSPVPLLDEHIAGIDQDLFGMQFCDLFSSAFPSLFFSEAMAFFYFSYYLMIPGVGFLLWIKNRVLYRSFIFTTALCFYFFYLVFSILPSEGPQFYLREGVILWKGYFFAPILNDILNALEVPTGAFPSSHVGIALIVTVFAWRFNKVLGVILTVLTSGLCAAVLYGGPHYFIDLPCGLVVGVIFILIAAPCFRFLKRTPRSDTP